MTRRPLSSDKGTSLVEASILLPLLFALVLGLSEIGFLVIDYLTVSNAAREGARSGAAAADYDEGGKDADFFILESVEEAACNLKFGKHQDVTIFEIDANGNETGEANLYHLPPNGSLVCGPGSGLPCKTPPCSWDPNERSRDPAALDAVGVTVRFRHDDVTGLFPFLETTWSETAIMQIEPDTSVGS
jgi:hypothetical protein